VSDIVAASHDFDLGAYATPEEALAALAGLADDAADDIERLRELLREELSVPWRRSRVEWYYRVREALGE
jgi:hypothetical protein